MAEIAVHNIYDAITQKTTPYDLIWQGRTDEETGITGRVIHGSLAPFIILRWDGNVLKGIEIRATIAVLTLEVLRYDEAADMFWCKRVKMEKRG